MVIIGISGDIGSGKSTFARALTEAEPASIHLESSDLIAETANRLFKANEGVAVPDPDNLEALNMWLAPLHEILSSLRPVMLSGDIFVVTADKQAENHSHYQKLVQFLADFKESDSGGHKITKANKEEYRPILQWLGGFVATMVSGRFWYQELIDRAQSKPLKLAVLGGVRFVDDARCIHDAGGIIVRIDRPALTTRDKADITEKERSEIDYDTVVANDGSPEDLQEIAAKLIQDIGNGRLKSSYKATT